MRQVLKTIMPGKSKATLVLLFERMDINRDGDVTWEEFVDYMINQYPNDPISADGTEAAAKPPATGWKKEWKRLKKAVKLPKFSTKLSGAACIMPSAMPHWHPRVSACTRLVATFKIGAIFVLIRCHECDVRFG